MDDLYLASICNFVFKCLERTDDTYRCSPSPNQTRQNSAHHLNVPFITSAQAFKSTKHSWPRLYNGLPTYIKERPTYIPFKFCLKRYILPHSIKFVFIFLFNSCLIPDIFQFNLTVLIRSL